MAVGVRKPRLRARAARHEHEQVEVLVEVELYAGTSCAGDVGMFVCKVEGGRFHAFSGTRRG